MAYRHKPGDTAFPAKPVKKKYGRIIIIGSILVSVILSGCAAIKNFEPVTADVTGIDQFGDVLLDIREIGLEYGDSVDLSFSGGYEIGSIQYYPDFYGSKGSTILTDFYDDIVVAGIGGSFNKTANIEQGEILTITLDKRGKYRKEYEAYNIDADVVRREGQSDEDYRNAREITAGKIRAGILYRGSSPFDKTYGRTELMDAYIRENNIRCILDLADSPEGLAKMEGIPAHVGAMVSGGQVIACPLGIDYTDPESMRLIGASLSSMAETDGPYLIQCSLGRDRTGVICAVIEALCGAGYDEIIADYMESYDRLHDIDMNPSSLQYGLFKTRLDEQLEAVFMIDRGSLPDSDLRSAARDYLIRCGMTEDSIGRLTERLI